MIRVYEMLFARLVLGIANPRSLADLRREEGQTLVEYALILSLIGVALMAPVSSFVAIFGVKVAHALQRRQLEVAFGLFLFLVSIRFIVSLI